MRRMNRNIRVAGKQGTIYRRTTPRPEHPGYYQLHCPNELPTRRQIFGPWLLLQNTGFAANFPPRPLAPSHLKMSKATPANSEFYERVRISRIRIIPTKTRPKFLIFLNKNNNLRKRTTATAGVIRPDSSHPCSYSGAYNSAPENPTS